MNISTTRCINTNADGKEYLTLLQVTFLITFDLVTLIANCFANFLVMLILSKTNQLSNYSMKFIFLLSFTDFFTGVSVQIFYIPVNVLPLQYPCSINLISQFLGATFTRISAYIVGLIGIDRYFRVKFKTFSRYHNNSASVYFDDGRLYTRICQWINSCHRDCSEQNKFILVCCSFDRRDHFCSGYCIANQNNLNNEKIDRRCLQSRDLASNE